MKGSFLMIKSLHTKTVEKQWWRDLSQKSVKSATCTKLKTPVSLSKNHPLILGSPNQLLQNPLIGKIWNFGASAVDTGATLISKVGGKLQEKLDETGVTYRVANVVNTAASKTTQIGSKIYHKSAEKIS